MDNIVSSLSIALSNPRLTLHNKLVKLCHAIDKAIPSCNRVSIWLFSDDYCEMTSLMCIDETNTISAGEELFSDTYSDYFDHILNNQFLVSSDAKNCDIAKCFNLGYFDIYDIHSLLDITFEHDFKPLGIICCERTGNKTEWTEKDLNQLKRIASITSTFLADNVSKTYSKIDKSSLIEKLS
ncbi:hypothetical protein HII17_06880 [Thalassotalea sp. M1531]|uniref:GAF domain-containing protein n=1 Tax=Thalassotalea algicola TaxID=2716224 RepID=A0A7Y0Q7Q4_9GAMM|nr:GAF domain-containing protein [Thalassotalea algicola]NMP31280.1 hypothetical protein [Thalassotalea algicola]